MRKGLLSAFSLFPTLFSKAVCLSLKQRMCNEWLEELPFWHSPFFSLAVFGENLRYCYSLCIVGVQKLWHFVISVIIEDIYLKLGVCVHYQKNNPCYQGRQFKMIFIFRIMPLLRHFNLYQAPSIGTRMRCSCSTYNFYPKRSIALKVLHTHALFLFYHLGLCGI